MSEDTLDRITSLIEAEANETLSMHKNDENRNPNEGPMAGMYQRKPSNVVEMFKQRNFAFPSNHHP